MLLLYKLRCCKSFHCNFPTGARKAHPQWNESTKAMMIWINFRDCRFDAQSCQHFYSFWFSLIEAATLKSIRLMRCEVRWERNWPPRCSLRGGVGGYTFLAWSCSLHKLKGNGFRTIREYTIYYFDATNSWWTKPLMEEILHHLTCITILVKDGGFFRSTGAGFLAWQWP